MSKINFRCRHFQGGGGDTLQGPAARPVRAGSMVTTLE